MQGISARGSLIKALTPQQEMAVKILIGDLSPDEDFDLDRYMTGLSAGRDTVVLSAVWHRMKREGRSADAFLELIRKDAQRKSREYAAKHKKA